MRNKQSNDGELSGGTLPDPASFFGSAEYFPLRFDQSELVFAHMTRTTCEQSIFCDSRRIVRAADQDIVIKCEALLGRFENALPPAANLCYVFHMAHGGSTLLARALDTPELNLVYREPETLKQLGTTYAAQHSNQAPPQEWLARLQLILRLLGRRYESGGPVIIKGAVPINSMLPILMNFTPGARAILLYSTLEDFLSSVLRSQVHRDWVSGVSVNLNGPIDAVTGTSVAERSRMPIARTAGCIWMTQAVQFASLLASCERTRAIDSESLFDQPKAVLEQSHRFFGTQIEPSRLDAVIAGPLFTRHSKFPERPYDNEARKMRRAKLLSSMADEIDAAFHWVEAKAPECGLAEHFGRPLNPDLTPPRLLERR